MPNPIFSIIDPQALLQVQEFKPCPTFKLTLVISNSCPAGVGAGSERQQPGQIQH
jgi:hypothetical protein